MKTHRKLIGLIAVLVVFGFAAPTHAQYDKWVEFTILRITEPEHNDIIPKGMTIDLECVAAIDIDVYCPTPTIQYNDTPAAYHNQIFTWSSTSGTWTDNSGPQAQWTAPTTTGTVTITVTASDDGYPYYANDVNRTHQITLQIVDPTIVYVDHTAATKGDGDGSSWEDAYDSLADALADITSGEIWVAQGTYYPGTSIGDYFSLHNGVEVYGGFAGDETAREQRDWVSNETILSADIGTENVYTDNCYKVVYCTHTDAVLDGFTVEKGYGYGTDGPGMYISGNISPTISNCIFQDNISYGPDADGGGMNCQYAEPTVTNCIFLNNLVGDDGGALRNFKGANGLFMNCAFYGNSTDGDNQGKSDGGAIFNTCGETGTPLGSCPTFINCVIAGNSTVRDGGGVANTGADTDPTYANCTIYGNSASDDGGGVSTKDDSSTTMKGCIIWGNTAVDHGDQIYNSGTPTGTTTVTYSDVQGGYGGNLNSDPIFAKTTDLDGPDNRWLTYDDGLRIKFNSLCIDAADGDAKDGTAVETTDALGLKNVDIRTVTDTGTGTPTYVDMGAYEAVKGHAIFISVDGLATKYLNTSDLMTNPNETVMKRLKQMKNEGLSTYEARTAHMSTSTTPNHIMMLTGRPVTRPSNWTAYNDKHHGWTYNGGFSDQRETMHMDLEGSGKGNNNLDYEASVYDVVHDRSGTTAEYAGKDKFIIHEWSYDLDTGWYLGGYSGGRADQVTPPDDSRDKIDTFEWTTDSGNSTTADWESDQLMLKFIDAGGVAEYPFNFTFFHFKGPDKVGHNSDSGRGPTGPWGSTGWDNNVKSMDAHLGTIMDMVRDATDNPELYYNTVIILTADHGGKNYGHGTITEPYNFTIPFFVWGHLIPAGDAYTYSDGTRTQPAVNTRVAYPSSPTGDWSGQPIRHADGVDLALNLMGLPSIDGATIKGLGLGQRN